MNTYNKPVKFKKWIGTLSRTQYKNGRIALILEGDEGIIAKCTVNLPEYPLADSQTFIKDYAENEGMLDTLVEAGAVELLCMAYTQDNLRVPIVKVLKWNS